MRRLQSRDWKRRMLGEDEGQKGVTTNLGVGVEEKGLFVSREPMMQWGQIWVEEILLSNRAPILKFSNK